MFNLNQSELKVLQLLVDGKSNSEIGKELFISLHTVKRHLENIYQKLDAHNRIQAIIVCIKNSIIEI